VLWPLFWWLALGASWFLEIDFGFSLGGKMIGLQK